MKRLGVVLAVLVVIILLAGGLWFLTASQVQEPTSVTLLLDIPPNPRHGPFLIAQIKGFFAEEGLNVTIYPGGGSYGAVTQVASGTAQFAFGDVASLVQFRSEHESDVIAVFMVYSQSPYVIHSLAETGIRTPKDLEGKTIGAPEVDSIRRMFPIFVKKTGIDGEKVNWVSIDFKLKLSQLLDGKVDAVTEYEHSKAIYQKRAAELGKTINTMLFRDYGVNCYINAILVSRKYAEENPEIVKKFLRAYVRALNWIFDTSGDKNGDGVNDEAIDTLLAVYPNFDEEVAVQELLILKNLVWSPEAKEHGLGYISLERMQETVDQVSEAFGLSNPPRAEDLFSNDYLP